MSTADLHVTDWVVMSWAIGWPGVTRIYLPILWTTVERFILREAVQSNISASQCLNWCKAFMSSRMMSGWHFGTNCDQCVRRWYNVALLLYVHRNRMAHHWVRTESPGRPPRLTFTDTVPVPELFWMPQWHFGGYSRKLRYKKLFTH